MKLYKLTDRHDQTWNRTQWGEGVEHTAPGTGELSGVGWLEAYTDPLLAVLLNPIHADFAAAHLWEAEGDVGKTDHGLKVGCTRLKTIKRLPLPEVTAEQRVRFGILCALEVCQNTKWRKWAADWLSGKDRTVGAAQVAQAIVAEEAWAAGAAAWAAWAAAEDAWAETWVAQAACAAAAWAEVRVDLVAIARKALKK